MFLNLTSECASHKPNFNQVFDSMKINGYPSYEDLIDLTKVMKFNNVEDRLLLCNFIFLHFKSLYDDDIKNEERYPEIKF